MEVVEHFQAWWEIASDESKQTVYIVAGFIGAQYVMAIVHRVFGPPGDPIQ